MDNKDTIYGWRVKINGTYVKYTTPVTAPEKFIKTPYPTTLADCYYAIGAYVQFDKQMSVSKNNDFKVEFEKVTHGQYQREQVTEKLKQILRNARDCGFSETELIELFKDPS